MIDVLVQNILVPLLLAVLTAAGTWLATNAVAWVKAKAKEANNQILANAFGFLGQTAAVAVTELTQTTVSHLKAAREDGKLTADEARAAFTAAVERTWQLIGRETRNLLTGEAGSEQAAKETIVGPVVEQMVAATKNEGSAAPPRTQEQAAKEVALARARLGLAD